MRRILPCLALMMISTTAMAADAKPPRLLIITGDNVAPFHDWKATTKAIREDLTASGLFAVDVTEAPAKDLTDANLAQYDALLLNYANTDKGTPETQWSEANKAAFLKAVADGKGLVVVHYASAAFARPNWPEFEKAIAGGWRTQGFHGPAHEFTVKNAGASHPIADGAPASFAHVTDELYQNSMLTPGSIILATAYSDPGKPKGTGKDEVVIWANTYGKGRVFNDVLGHDAASLTDPGSRDWLRRGAEWAATGKVELAPK